MAQDQDFALHQALRAATGEVVAYVGCDAYKAVARMLGALIDGYHLDLVSVSPEALASRQAALKQARAIQQILDGTSVEIPKI